METARKEGGLCAILVRHGYLAAIRPVLPWPLSPARRGKRQ